MHGLDHDGGPVRKRRTMTAVVVAVVVAAVVAVVVAVVAAVVVVAISWYGQFR